MNNELIEKFINDNGLDKFKKEYVASGIVLKDNDNSKILICCTPFTLNMIDVYFDDIKRTYQYNKNLNDTYSWYIINEENL